MRVVVSAYGHIPPVLDFVFLRLSLCLFVDFVIMLRVSLLLLVVVLLVCCFAYAMSQHSFAFFFTTSLTCLQFRKFSGVAHSVSSLPNSFASCSCCSYRSTFVEVHQSRMSLPYGTVQHYFLRCGFNMWVCTFSSSSYLASI